MWTDLSMVVIADCWAEPLRHASISYQVTGQEPRDDDADRLGPSSAVHQAALVPVSVAA